MKLRDILIEQTRYVGIFRDYVDNTVLLSFIGQTPSKKDVNDIMKLNYGTVGEILDIQEPSSFRGQENPGMVLVGLYKNAGNKKPVDLLTK